MSRRGMAASSQPLAVEAAINILRSGGNAIDAAVTATLVLAVIEPMSTGLGGDCFSLIYLNQEKRLLGLNASGRAPDAISVEALHQRGIEEMPLEGTFSITVPGMLDGLVQCLARYGTISLQDALKPAIEFAESGFPIPEITAQMWQRSVDKLQRNSESARVFLPDGSAPHPGQVFRNSDLAQTLRTIGKEGSKALYNGPLGEKIVGAVCDLDGLISLTDLSDHTSDWVEPIRTSYRGHDVIEMPPNNQGLAALIALNIVEGYRLSELPHNSAPYLHLLVQAMRAALSDARNHIGDPDQSERIDLLLSEEHANQWRSRFNSHSAQTFTSPSVDQAFGDTVYVAVVDGKRNVVSMISSLFKSFGSGVTVPGTGVIMQNRGSGFSLENDHPNRLGSRRRPYHTIMPAMIMRDAQPLVCLGVVGGMMQAQGHLQIICNLIDFEMDPQSAVDAPRFRVLEDGKVALESGIEDKVRTELASWGHKIDSSSNEEGFGGAQVIQLRDGTLFGASDPRKDGCALGF